MVSAQGLARASKPSGEPGWKWRRLVIFPAVVWTFHRLAQMENGPDTRVNETIAWGYLILILVLTLGYTGFATVQDVIAIWRTRSGLPYREEMQPVPPEHLGEVDDDPDKPPAGYAGN